MFIALDAEAPSDRKIFTLIYRLRYICVMEISVAEIARMRGLSPRRVLQLIAAGEISARRVGGQWLIEQSEILKSPRLARPMSARMAWGLIYLMSGQESPHLGPTERSRLRSRLNALVNQARNGDHVIPQLSSLLRERARTVSLRARPEALIDIRLDKRLILSGISDPRSRMSAGEEVEAYVRPGDVQSLMRDWFLVEGSWSTSNVRLHVADMSFSEAPLGLIIADLADHARPREQGEAERLLAAVAL